MADFWKGKKVLVTGGAGMIGSYLSEFLIEDGAKVTVADNLERGSLHNIQSIKRDIKFLELDLKKLDNCLKACKGQEIVINCVAKVTGIEYNRSHHKEMFESNMLLQQMPIHAAHECGVKRFTQISTACIYPHDAKVPTPEIEGERGGPEPTNQGYGWAKRMGERLADYYNRETEMECIIIRPFNGYGPRDYFDAETSHVIPALMKKILDGNNPVHIWGSGNQSRVFVHCRDFAKGIQLITEKAQSGAVVNNGHDEQITIKELFYKICDILDMHPEPNFDTSLPEGYARRAADTTLIKEITGGFVPNTTLLEDGIKEMLGWFREHGQMTAKI